MSEQTADNMFPEATLHQLPVKIKLVPGKNKIDEEGFIEEVEKFLSTGKHIWRSSGKIATHFSLDSVELDKFLSKHEKIASRANDEHEVFYALKSRLEQKVEKPRPVVVEEDRYALSQISLIRDMMDQVLKRFGMTIHAKSSEAFSYLVKGKSELDIGLMHFANATKANLEKLD